MRININKLNDINIKLSSNNEFPNKCKTINDNLGINNNKSNNNPLKITDNKVKSRMTVVMLVTTIKLIIKMIIIIIIMIILMIIMIIVIVIIMIMRTTSIL